MTTGVALVLSRKAQVAAQVSKDTIDHLLIRINPEHWRRLCVHTTLSQSS